MDTPLHLLLPLPSASWKEEESSRSRLRGTLHGHTRWNPSQ
jgi:hypothetical protein